MKNFKGLKAVAIYMMVAFVSVCVSMSFVSCDKDDATQHGDYQNEKARLGITVKGNTDTVYVDVKESYNDSLWYDNNTPHDKITWDSLHNDTIKGHEQVEVYLNATANRKEAELEVTASQLATLRYTGKAISRKVDGRNHLISNAEITDNCGQLYSSTTDAIKAALKKYTNIHLHVDTVVTSLKDSTRITPKAGELVRYDWTTELVIKGHAVNTPSNKACEIKFDLKDQRYIKAAKPDEPKVELDSIGYKLVDKGVGDGIHDWELQRIEYWNNDSTHMDTEKEQTIWSAVAVNPADRIVSTFDGWNFNSDNLKWNNNWTKNNERSNSNRTSMIETGYKRGYCSNGFGSDSYTTDAEVSHEKVTRIWGGHTWEIPADDVKLVSGQNSFIERASDRSGYDMLVFTNVEKAVNGSFSKNLQETNKLYLKVAAPADLESIEFAGTKVHTNGMAKIDGSVIPVYSDGSKGSAIAFKWERAENWYWKNDSVIAEGVTFVMQETGTLKLKGSESKTAKTFATSNENITIKCNQYDADFQTTVNVDGQTKVTTWHATWYEDFRVCYEGKEVALNKSSYNVKNQNDKLTKDEARSTATTEVWKYSVDGIFNIDEDSRSAYGYGRITKSLDETLVRIYWDEASKGQSHTMLQSTRWATLVREYNTGKKTTQEYRHVFNRLSNASHWEVYAEEGSEKAANSLSIENTNENERTDDFAHFTVKKFELGQFFDIEGAAQQHDKVTFTESLSAYFEVKDIDGNPIRIFFEDPSYSFTNNVKDLVVVKEATEADPFTQYKHENVCTWNFGGATTTVSATGLIKVEAQYGGGEPDYDFTVETVYATVSRPSNRNAADITAYTYLLVGEGKCLPLGFYNGMLTVGEVENYVPGMNSACYVKDQNKVVATTCTLANGIIKYKDGNGNVVDAGTFIQWQGAGFNDRGNDFVNHTGLYKPHAVKQGNVYVVTFEGTNVSYTFKGWTAAQ